MDDMLPVWPSAYPSAMTYDFFTYAGAPGAYNLALGAGAGVYWKSNDFSISTSLSQNGNLSNPEMGGIGTMVLTSAPPLNRLCAENWGIAAAYARLPPPAVPTSISVMATLKLSPPLVSAVRPILGA